MNLDRANTIGGSDIAPILGISPYKSILDVFNEKYKGNLQDISQKPVVIIGKQLEVHCLDDYCDEACIEKSFLTRDVIVQDKKYEYLVGSLDAIDTKNNYVVEAKTTLIFGKTFSNGLPPYYKAQVAFYLYLTDLNTAKVMVLFYKLQNNVVEKVKHQIFTYERDLEFETSMIQSAVNFYENHLKTGIPPKATSLEDLKKNLVFKEDCEEVKVDADEEIVNIAEKIKSLKKTRLESEKEEEKLKTRIIFLASKHMEHLDDGKLALKEIALMSRGKKIVTIAYQKRESIDLDAFKKSDLFEVCKKFQKTSFHLTANIA